MMNVTKEKMYDLDQLEEIADGNGEFLTELAAMYVETIPTISVELVAAAKAGDWLKVSKLAHKLKSTIDSMNMFSIKSDIRSLEIDARNKVNTAILYKLTLKVYEVVHAVAQQIKTDFNL